MEFCPFLTTNPIAMKTQNAERTSNPSGQFAFDRDDLARLAHEQSPGYLRADPFPHTSIDRFLPEPLVQQLIDEFPTKDSEFWNCSDQKWETKRSCEDETKFPDSIRHVLQAFNSSTFVTFLETLTGIPGLIPDPHFRGGGMHCIVRGGKLGIHADFNFYKRLGLYRRLNVLLYLNPDWEPEFGGELELWDGEMKKSVKSYAPLSNRCVIFSTTDTSFHGHPTTLKCPESRSRNSLALYYYTCAKAPEGSAVPHSTLFQRRPETDDEVPASRKNLLSRISRRLFPRGGG